MKVLICIKNGPVQRYVVTLHTKTLIKEIMDLVDSNRHSQAVMKVLSKGRFEREVVGTEAHSVEADLILSETNVRWDLKK